MFAKLKEFYSKRCTANLFSLNGAVPLNKALPFGLQHVLVMFLSNITPIIVVLGTYEDHYLTVNTIQAALLIAGLGTIIQLYPVWRFGSGLPSVVGVSFTFIGAMLLIGTNYDYGTMVGSMLVGGIFMTVIGLLTKFWRKAIKPIVSAIVVLGIGLGLISLGVQQFFSLSNVLYLRNYEFYDFSLAWPYLLISSATLISALLWSTFVKGIYKNISVFIGLIVGYTLSLIFNAIYPDLGILNFSYFSLSKFTDYINIPHVIDFSIVKFNPQAIIFTCIVYLVASTEGVGDTIAIAHGGLSRNATDREIAGGLACDGLISVISALFGSLPLTTSSENVGLIGKSKIVNRFTILLGAVFLVFISFFPPVAIFLETIPDAVLGGCMMLVYISILVIGIEMVSKVGFTRKNILIVGLSIALGYGTSMLGSEFFNSKSFVGDWAYLELIMENPEANMFVIAFLLSYVIPDEEEDKLIDYDKQVVEISSAKEKEEGVEEKLSDKIIKKDEEEKAEKNDDPDGDYL
jgi:uracil-xanthine permease